MKNLLGRIWYFIKEIFYKYRFFWKRVGFSLITLVLAVIFGFVIIKLMPGDVVAMYARNLANQRKISYEDAYRMAVQLLNYDPQESVFNQLGKYLNGLFHGNLGTSMYRDDVSALTVIRDFLPWTLLISGISLLLSFFLGVVMGGKMAAKRKGFGNAMRNTYVVVSGAMPDYIWGLLLIYFLAVRKSWFPMGGSYDLLLEDEGMPWLINVLYHAALPIIAYTIVQTGSWALSMRGSAIGVLGEDYIYAARVRGVSERRIRSQYLTRNALLPLVTSFAVSFGAIFGGSPLMENIFNYPGFGAEFNTAIGDRDYFLIQGLMVFMSFMIILANFIADSVYSLVDPRVRREN